MWTDIYIILLYISGYGFIIALVLFCAIPLIMGHLYEKEMEKDVKRRSRQSHRF